ncbi:sigma-70 family RNA polymerase sigma factor [Nocardia yunnanensis]|uniref:Sigma-70 family RNA polymerase sigma factor n=1 Tax=Nocardia yunnanensis TaxID=2382165 RepID=A0A386ZKF6_9NOCA|nr:RNA polymerase sigma factor SigJ [Nocardia yunnanensis]AYF77936.1 sigma-70 family RNA polymerase sigma factor [Nocardia yunnanensis]
MLGVREVEVFEGCRGRLEAIAYRILGSASDAEDAVQDTFLRWSGTDRDAVENPEAWLTKVLTNVCSTQMGSARVRRESYVGQWLPEPVLAGDRMLGPDETVVQRESVSIAMLAVLQRLSIKERVVYVLREAFGYSHAEIAEMLELTEANCQQILRRAKQHVALEKPRAEIDEARAREVVEEFLAAALSGRTDALVQMLSEGVFHIGDGGGRLPSLDNPIVGALAVARFLRGILRPNQHKRDLVGGNPVFHFGLANGGPAVVLVNNDQVAGVLTMHLTADGIAAIHTQVNPDKLARANRQWAAIAHEPPLIESW